VTKKNATKCTSFFKLVTRVVESGLHHAHINFGRYLPTSYSSTPNPTVALWKNALITFIVLERLP